MKTIFYNARVITPELIFSGGIVVDGNTIERVFKDDEYEKGLSSVDCKGNYLAPGFVDIHNHGTAAGMLFTADPEELERGAMLMADHGTTTVVPTSPSQAHKVIYDFLINVRNVMGHNKGSKLFGAHLEGNYFNMEYAGAQNPEFIYPPREEEYMEFIDTGIVKRVSSSPEVPGCLEMAEKLSKQGILMSMAHSGANYDDVLRAINAGYTHITHIYNAISFLNNCYYYPQVGACEAALLHDEITVEAICDGRHVPAPLIRLMYKAKGADRMHAVTDACLAGATDGSVKLFGLDCLVDDGVCMLADRSAFAGSVTTNDVELKVLVNDAMIPLTDAVKMLSLTPARTIGAKDVGRIAAGYKADINILNSELDVVYTMIDGREYRNVM